MNDKDLRSHVLKKIRRSPGASASTVLEEFGVNHGQARADIAVFSDLIHGYELKSDLDSLERLGNQVRAYSECFDKVTLVTSYKLAGRALHMTPTWWGVLLAHEGRLRGIKLAEARRAIKNPALNPIALSRLLWRDEAMDLLKRFSAQTGLLSKPRKELYERLAETVPLSDIRAHVIACIKNRKWSRAAGRSR